MRKSGNESTSSTESEDKYPVRKKLKAGVQNININVDNNKLTEDLPLEQNGN